MSGTKLTSTLNGSRSVEHFAYPVLGAQWQRNPHLVYPSGSHVDDHIAGCTAHGNAFELFAHEGGVIIEKPLDR